MFARALVLACVALGPVAAHADFSADLDRLWDFGDPVVSEARFRAEQQRWPVDSPEALEAATQVARTQGLRRQFDPAHATLDGVEAKAAASTARVRVRLALERGRVFNSAGDPARAVPLFERAAGMARVDPGEGRDYYLVDALHMLGIAAAPAERLRWNLAALDAAEASADARARGWRASLLNNLGWAAFDAGDAPRALDYWQRALAAREAAGTAAGIRIAKWTVARGYRAVGRLDDAQALQLALAAETEAAGEPDGYVYEELAEIALARGDAAAARPWAAKAHALLAADAGFATTQPARLERLARAAAPATGRSP
jgi:tetratricopeptide (TPR) repeat protein